MQTNNVEIKETILKYENESKSAPYPDCYHISQYKPDTIKIAIAMYRCIQQML